MYVFLYKLLTFDGHRSAVTAVCFGNKVQPLTLCSASEDFIFVWNVTSALEASKINDGNTLIL